MLLGFFAKQGVRGDRLGALFVLRNPTNSSWLPQPESSMDGVQHLIADVHPTVGVWISALILILGEAGFSNAHGELLTDDVSRVVLLPKNLPEGPSCFEVRSRFL